MLTSPQNKALHIGKRLETVADIAAVRLSREETLPLTAIDVGTDHAKLPLYLVAEKGFSSVIAADINKGPCDTARKNIAAAGEPFTSRIRVVQTDGLTGLEDAGCRRVIMAGMGGELIRDILRRAPFFRREKEATVFVLQPQSRAQLLRDYLYEEGYRICQERLCRDGNKIYQVLSAVYDGKVREASQMERYFGKDNILRDDPLFRQLFSEQLKRTEKNLRDREGREHTEERCRDMHQREKILLAEMKAYRQSKGETV